MGSGRQKKYSRNWKHGLESAQQLHNFCADGYTICIERHSLKHAKFLAQCFGIPNLKLIYLIAFFFLFEQKKSTYTEHVHFIIVPLKILRRGYFQKEKKKGLQRQCRLHVSREPCALQLSHLGLCQCHMFSFWKWLFSENITANRCKEGGDECVRIYCKKMEKSLGWLFMNSFSVSN